VHNPPPPCSYNTLCMLITVHKKHSVAHTRDFNHTYYTLKKRHCITPYSASVAKTKCYLPNLFLGNDILFYLALTWCQKTRENHIEIESGFTMSRAPCQDCPTKATSAGTKNTEKKKHDYIGYSGIVCVITNYKHELPFLYFAAEISHFTGH